MIHPTKAILLSGAALALLPTTAYAQATDTAAAPTQVAQPQPSDAASATQTAANAAVADIIVTGSRVVTNGSLAPTPVTVLSQTELLQRAPSSLPDALNTLPTFTGSASPAKSAVANPAVARTANTLNLRDLGAVRVLTLLDGMRLPPEGATGLVDSSLVPQMLVQGIDVVTGGASAAYGSDAVSGVVNFRLNKTYQGVGLLAQGGVADRGDYASRRLGVVAGHSFLDDRLHIEGSAEYYKNDGIGAVSDRYPGANNCTIVGVNGGVGGTAANPYTPVCGTATSNIAFGGYFANAQANNAVVPGVTNTLFVGQNSLVPFSGTIVGSGVCTQCNAGYHDPRTISLIPSVQTDHYFARADFKATDRIGFFVQGLYAHSDSFLNGSTTLTRAGAATQFVIFPTNPYLPANIAAAIPATGIGFARQSRDLGNVTADFGEKTYGISTGVNGSFVNNWKWDISYSHGRSQEDLVFQQVNNVNLRAALDAVVNPATGTIVCRVSITNPGLYPGCVPINLFGEGNESAAAIAYVRGVGTQRSVFKQDVVEGNLRGNLFDLWAGPVSGAVGAAYRKQTFLQTSNSDPAQPITTTGIRGYSGLQYVTANFAVGGGSVDVKEGYGEIEVPLLRDMSFTKSLDLNGAVRYTDYSTSGAVTTWKAGLSWEPIGGVRFRGTRSRDIRAPTLVELYQGAQPSQQLVADAHTGLNQGYLQIASGNTALQPEKADTTTVGVVVKPAFLRGLTASLDYYDIKIHDAIAQPYTPLQILQLCEASGGTSSICSSIVRPFPFSNTTAANFPTSIAVQPLNVASIATRGIDAEVDYVRRVGKGNVALRALATYVIAYTQQQSPLNPPQNVLGTNDLGGGLSLPQFKGTVSAAYTVGNFTIDAIESIIGGLHQSNVTYYVNNDVPAIAYTSLDLSITVPPSHGMGRMELFFNVSNLFDKSPPFIPAANPGLAYPTYRSLYDVVGRAFTAGVRVKL
jgi:outer membrane receptor protein involved in Fe transport